MNKVIKMPEQPKHIYETGLCVGCGIEILDEYTDVAITSVDGSKVTHVALCTGCNEIAEQYQAY